MVLVFKITKKIMVMVTIKHQLIEQEFFIPQWKIKHLFLGTFNPEGGVHVPYYYGRRKNFTWKILNEIFPGEFRNEDLSMRSDFFERLEVNGVGCMDVIRSVQIAEENVHLVTGKGYSDGRIINNKVKRDYNTTEINKVITANPGISVYSKWGTGSNLADWNRQVALIKSKIISLRSPSPVARVPAGTEKYRYAFEDWYTKIRI